MTTDGGIYELMRRQWSQGRLVCVGLDPDLSRLPVGLGADDAGRVTVFCREIADATAEFAAAFKLNSAFFERMGVPGVQALERTITYIKQAHPDRVVIVDAKRGDIDNTNLYYAEAVFDTWGADVVTVHPYMGRESLEPFLRRRDKGVIVMGANSCAGVGEFQDLPVGPEGIPLYEYVCRRVAGNWNHLGNCAVTAGATEPAKLARIREAVGDMPILLLGLGAQGGDIDECLRVGKAQGSFGLIANSSRAILYASSGSDFAQAAHLAAARFNQRLSE
ncbi:orotidine-5'-phosphate decarboxylase [Polymorphospora lycopeni]|uniref:Orotidine-5'-phosphate decarboxylase n=1 Tax=Polymorphospora lycopeni TaxID=3140240 RepID=A0ABV5CR18_9ACTN